MKKLSLLWFAATVCLALPGTAAETKATPAPVIPPIASPADTPAVPATPPKVAPPLPMHSRVDFVDAVAKTFTQKRKDGVEVKHFVTDKTEFKTGDKPATFADIKVGDYVNGLRRKKSATEWEVVKITKIASKAGNEVKPAE